MLAPATAEPDPGSLTVELAAPDGNRDRSVLLVPDRNQLPLYRIRVLEVTGEDCGLGNADEYRAVLTH